MDNRNQLTRIRKSDLVLADLTTDTGLIPEAHAETFIKLLMLPSVFMTMADVRSMKAPTQKWPRIGMSGRVLNPSGELQSLSYGQRANVETEFYTLTTSEFKGELRLNDNVLEDNVERGQLVNTVLGLMADRTRVDMEDLLINGDTGSADPLLATFDGLIKQTTSNLVPVSPSAILSADHLKDAIKAYPQEYMRKKPQLKFLTAPHANIEYSHSFTSRETPLGDGSYNSIVQNGYHGVPIVEVPLFPSTLGAGTNESVVILCDPKDFKVGFWRELRMETDRDIRHGFDTWVISTRFGCVWEYEPATAKITGILAD